jgi:hypothetical protein
MEKLLFAVIIIISGGQARAQGTVNYVTEIVTDYGKFWRSGTGTTGNAPLSATKPDNSHNLIAFSLDGVRYATGVNDELLKANELTYKAGRYQALSVDGLTSSTVINSNTKVGLGQLYDKVHNGPSSPPPTGGYERYLSDGVQGLDLGTGVANLPAGTLTFAVSSVAQAAIGDGVPDVLVTQFASPDTGGDKYQFLDASGKAVGTAVTVVFVNVPVVGNWMADFYEASQSPMTLGTGFTNTGRDLRLWAADFSSFGITASDYSRIKSFQITLNGSSDQAFVAYNTAALSIQPLPVTLTAFTGAAQGSAVHLTWQTASEREADAFVVEASTDGSTFVPVGRVAAAGTTAQAQRYAFGYQPPQSGLGYYRLRQFDHDGTGYYSPVVAVRTGAAAVAVFPSVFDEALTVRLPAAGSTALALLAPDGRLLYQQHLGALPAQDLALPSLATLPPGLYLLRVVLDGRASLHRVVKQ